MLTIVIDGVVCDFVKTLKRISNQRRSDLSGTLLNGAEFNDILGQYLDFEVELAPFWWLPGDRYATLYQAITAPVDGHTIVVPYNEGNVTINARIEKVEDECVRRPDGRYYWLNPTFTITANAPTRQMDLDTVLLRGMSPLPELSEGVEGDAWIYKSASGWVHESYPDGDASYW